MRLAIAMYRRFWPIRLLKMTLLMRAGLITGPATGMAAACISAMITASALLMPMLP